MGSWNQTDLLTNLPIRPGEPVRAIVMTPWVDECSHLPFGPSDPTHRYQPVALPMRGTYSAYGWIDEVVEDAGAATVRRYFAEKHQLTDLSLDALDETLDTLVRAAQARDGAEESEEQAPAEATPQAGYYAVALMHEGTYQALLAATANIRDWSRTMGAEVDAQIAAFRAAIEQKPWGVQFSPDYDGPSAHDAMSAHQHLAMNVAGDAIFDYVAEGRDDETVLAAARDFLLFLNGLRLGRISLQPTSGQGRHEAAYNLQKALFEAGLAQISIGNEDEEAE